MPPPKRRKRIPFLQAEKLLNHAGQKEAWMAVRPHIGTTYAMRGGRLPLHSFYHCGTAVHGGA